MKCNKSLNKIKVLVVAAFYPPAFKGGGPIQSVYNLVESLGNEYEFTVVTSDRDLGDKLPFQEVLKDTFIRVGKANVMYCSPKKIISWTFYKVLNSVSPDIVFVNSFFGRWHSMLPLFFWKIGKVKANSFLLAPRGEFSKGSLSIKPRRKKIYLNIIGKCGFYRKVAWLLTTKYDAVNVSRYFFKNAYKVSDAWSGTDCELSSCLRDNKLADYYIIPNLPTSLIGKKVCTRSAPIKKAGYAKLLFLSRISPEKNCLTALRIISEVKGDVEFNIYGPIDRVTYWEECKTYIGKLPKNIKVNYCDAVAHELIEKVFRSHHALLFPTLGENFGHVIQESFIYGCPVIISDRTPWRDLERHEVGWDIPLEKPDVFVRAVQKIVDIDEIGYTLLSKAAAHYGKKSTENVSILNEYRKMFNQLGSFQNKLC